MRGLRYIAPAFVAFTLVPAAFESASAAPDPTGIWMDDTGRGAVEIKQCGTALCGNVVWVKAATDASGCGKQIIGDVAPVGGGHWDNGWIYSPEKARKYDVELTPLADGTLRVTGYAGMKFLSKTMIWKRPSQDLQLCGQTEAKADTPAPVKSDATTGSIATTAPATPPAPAAAAEKPVTTASAETAAPVPAPAPAAANTVSDAAKAQSGSTSSQPPKETDANAAPKDETAPADDNGDNGIGKALGNLKLGDLDLDKVLTKTKSGKCNLDLPWFKVQFNCERQ